MQVKIKNTTKKITRAIVLGNLHHNLNLGHAQGDAFFNFNTDKGVEISFDGKTYREHIHKILTEIENNPIKVKEFVYVGNKLSVFRLLRIDAAGRMAIYPLVPLINPEKTIETPIVFEEVEMIDGNTSFLFILEPNEEVTLNII